LTSGDCGSYDEAIYFKGSRFLNFIRIGNDPNHPSWNGIGTTNFFNGLRDIVSSYRYDVLTTAKVKSVFLAHAPDPTALSNYMANYLK
jgi:hypothetical protein